jgi:hypothetical protein
MPTVEVRGFAPEFKEGVLGLLGRLDPRPSAQPMWERLLAYTGPGPELPSGYVLLSGQKVAGFLGTLYSERQIRGGSRLLCNMSSWIVDESHRGGAYVLLRQALRPRHLTMTNFSPTVRVSLILRQLGFQPLEHSGYFISLGYGLAQTQPRVRILTARPAIEPLLDERCGRFFRDHAYPHCRHLHVSSSDGDCYVLYTTRRKRRLLPYAHVHFISNRRVFSQATASIVRHLAKTHGSLGLLVEGRFVEPPRREGLFVRRVKLERLYRTSSLEPGDVDHLYSELPVLGL